MKFLISGLGNIGGEYEMTRHNIGFMALDKFAEIHKVSFIMDRLSYVAEYKFKGRTFLLIKPTTYMNLSGKAVAYWLQTEKIPLEHLLVITDDLNLPLGALRIRGKGSSGGQNGLNNINTILQTENYARMRLGIGSDFPKGRQVEYVLGRFSPQELSALQPVLEKASNAILSFGTDGLERTMNVFNSK